MLQEVGLLRDGLLTEATGTALWACDEKGLESTDGKVKFHRAAAPKALGKVTADVPSASWGHVTLLPFVSLDGHVDPPNVILQGSSFMKSWSKVWPAANVAANEKASCTADLFSQFVLLWARHCRDVLQVPAAQQLVLVCDSGGGSLVHLSVECTQLCHQLNVRLFLLGPYLTRAVMCLDQTPNCEAERAWQKIRRESMPATQLEVLDASHEVWDAGYSKDHIVSGWKRIGFAHKCAINRNVVLVDWQCELFRKTLSAGEMSVEQVESQLLLPRPKGYTRGKCLATCEACLKQTPTNLPLCGFCGNKNANYSPVKEAIAAGAKAGGYSRKQEPLCDVNSVIDQIPAATKANLSKFCGDVLGQMRKRKPCGAENVENSAEAPAEAAPATPAKKPRVEKLAAAEVSAPISCAPASSKAACQPAPAAPQEEEEFDLDDHDQAVKYLALHWTSPPPNLLPTLNFFVSTLKSRASKSQPLSQLLMKEIVKPKALYTRKNRQDFLSAWKSNRSLRYAAKPKFVQ